MSKLFDEASDIIGLSRDLTLQDYKRFKEIQKNITENELDRFAWLLEGLSLRLPKYFTAKKVIMTGLEARDDD